MVSIDPIKETEKTGIQTVCFEGGIEDTQFGQDLLNADYELKQIAMGLLPSGVLQFKTYWDLNIEEIKASSVMPSEINSRFWFYPINPSVVIREDVVVIKGLKVGVFTEVLSAKIDGKNIEDLSTFQDTVGITYAKTVSDNFEELAKVYTSFSRVQGLDELVALTKAIEEMDKIPDLSFWLKEYKVKRIETKKELHVLRRKEKYELPLEGMVELSGGVSLVAIAMRLKSGNVAALKEAVLNTKPKYDALSWGFILGEWIIPTSKDMLNIEDIIPLFNQAMFLHEQKYYDDAITIYEKIIELKPDLFDVYLQRAWVYFDKEDFDAAIRDFDKYIKFNSNNITGYARLLYDVSELKIKQDRNKAIGFAGRGLALGLCGQNDRAIAAFNKALEIDQTLVEVYSARAFAYKLRGDFDNALSDFNHAINLRNEAIDYCGRSGVFMAKGDLKAGLKDIKKAIDINPNLAEAWAGLAFYFATKGKYKKAIENVGRALTIDPKCADAWLVKGVIYDMENQKAEAIEALNSFIVIALPVYGEQVKFVREKIGKLEADILNTKSDKFRVSHNIDFLNFDHKLRLISGAIGILLVLFWVFKKVF